MNTFRKSAIVFITFTLIVLCSCSNTDSTITTKSNRSAPAFIPATYEKNITGSDVYDDGWYFEDLEHHNIVKVKNYEPTKGATWNVYFTEGKLAEDEIEKLKEREPDIINSGEFNASKCSYIYVYCSINSTNSTAPTSDMLQIYYQTQ